MSDSPRPVYFVLHPQFLLLDLAGVAEAFRYGNEFAPPGTRPFEFHYVSPSRRSNEVPSSVGIALVRTGPLPERLEDDAIVVIDSTIAARAEVSPSRNSDDRADIAESYASATKPQMKGETRRKFRSEKFGDSSVELTTAPTNTITGTPARNNTVDRRRIASIVGRPKESGPRLSVDEKRA